jgi:hypothetical protein
VTVEYDSLNKLVDACQVLDAHGIGWAAASCLEPNPFGEGDTVIYRLYASQQVPS